MRKERIVFDYRHYFLRSVVFLYYHLGENGFLILLGVVTVIHLHCRRWLYLRRRHLLH